MNILMLPGFANSGPLHWQSLWEKANTNYLRVNQADWQNPNCSHWLAALEESVKAAGPNTILVAHSLGCLLVAHWAATTQLRIKAAMLVAVPNPASPLFPAQITGFTPVPMQRLPFNSIVVASSDDPYAQITYVEACAAAWGSALINIGAAGHINAASGLGAWAEGQRLLQQCMLE
jgi:predicted alpha/beta hydrolase family esterase